MTAKLPQARQLKPALNTAPSKGLRKILCITTLAFTASLVGCGAEGILPGGSDNTSGSNPFDQVLGIESVNRITLDT